MNVLYLCDPRKNRMCRGTVCFYGAGPWHWCCLTNDPHCAVEGPDGEPLAVDLTAGILGYDKERQDDGVSWPPAKGGARLMKDAAAARRGPTGTHEG